MSFDSPYLPGGISQRRDIDDPPRPVRRGDTSADNQHDPNDAKAAMRYLIVASGDSLASLYRWRCLCGLRNEASGWKAKAFVDNQCLEGPEAMTPYAAVSGWVKRHKTLPREMESPRMGRAAVTAEAMEAHHATA